MKILQIIHSYPPQSFGGSEFYTQSLTEELAKKHQVMIIYSKLNKNNPELLLDGNLESKNIFIKPVTRIPPTNFVSTYYNPSADHEIVNIIRNYSPDLVHIEHLMHHSISIIHELSALSLPIIITLHDYWYLCPQCFLTKPKKGGLCEGPQKGTRCLSCENADKNLYIPLVNSFSSNPIAVHSVAFLKNFISFLFRNKIKLFCLNILKRFTSPYSRLNETKTRLQKMVTVLNEANLIIAPSNLLAERYNNEGVKNIIVLSHGIQDILDKDFKKDKYDNISNKNITFAYVGSISRHKGVHVLIEAFNKIISPKAELLIYGKMGLDIPYEKELISIKRSPYIKFMGFVEHNKIYELLKNVDVIVIPSICTENYPLIANEAFLAQTPVIASNVGGLNELVKNGVSGFIFESGNSHKLFEIINNILTNPDILRYLSKNIPHVKNMTEHAHEIELLYEKVIRLKSVQQKSLIA